MISARGRFVVLAISFLGLAGCGTSKVVLNEAEFTAHPSVDFEWLRFRRPSTPVFDSEAPKPRVTLDAAGNPLAEPPRELGNLDCERSEDFFAKLNLSAIRACFTKTAMPTAGAAIKPFELEWGLRKDGQPTLELRNPDEAPECFRTSLAEIPFPREMVYVVAGENPARGECFTSRLTLDPGVLLGWELPRARIRLRVIFPLKAGPKTDREVERTLRAWTLSIYRGGSREQGQFHGRFLPTRLCTRCLGIPDDFERGAATVPPPASLWPSRAGAESVGWGSN